MGSGVAGLACARTLHDHGVDVVVFDKGRAPGGRLASRRTPELVVDLGAQYFTARDERFRRFVNSWVDDGLVALWTGRVRAVDGRGGDAVDTAAVERFVGTPSMNAIARHFARELAVRVSQRVDRVERLGRGFVLHGTVGQDGTTLGPRDVSKDEPPEELGTFDALALCIPPAQACELLDGVSASLAAASAQVTFDPCVAFGFVPEEADALRAIPFDGLFVGRDGDPDRILAWVARDSSKPMRPDGEAWVVHASPEWSRAHLREPREALERTLLEEVARVLRLEGLRARSSALQRWAFARAPSPLERPLFDDDARAGVGGDWTAGGRVEGAFLSGVALAGRVLGLTCT